MAANDTVFRAKISQRRNIHRGSHVTSLEEFSALREQGRNTMFNSDFKEPKGVRPGEKILEKQLHVSKDPETYYRNKKVYSNINEETETPSRDTGFINRNFPFERSASEAVRYQQNMPTFMRIMDDPTKRNVVHKRIDGEPADML